MKIAIIGAGPSGLCAAKELSQSNAQHDITIFEASNKIGGVFAHSYKGLRLVNNSFLIAFSDFFEGLTTTNLHMTTAEEYVAYLQRYAEHFNVLPKIKFSSKVTTMQQNNSVWDVTVEHGSEKKQHQFDYVVVCSGVHYTPSVPILPNQNNFTGKIIHGDEVDDPAFFKGKDVVLVGTGEYGSDLSYLIGKVANSIAVSIRRWAGYVIPRYHDGQPTDLDTSRLYHGLPKNIIHSKLGKLLSLKRWIEFRKIKNSYDKKIQMIADKLNAGCPTVGVFQRTSSKSENLPRAILECGLKIKPKIVGFDKNDVLFSDGTRVRSDYVILCTGYKAHFSFLDDAVAGQTNHIRRMYKYMLPLQTKNIAFLGFIRPGVGSIPPMSELQARYLTLLLDGKKSLPTHEQMQIAVRNQEIRDYTQFPLDAERVTGLTDYFTFLSGFAKDIGCEPKKWHLLLTNPRLFYKVFTAFLCPAQFRLYGPDANKAQAEKIIKNLPTMPFSILFIEVFVALFSKLLITSRKEIAPRAQNETFKNFITSGEN